MLGYSMLRSALWLCLFALCTAALIAWTLVSTRPAIAKAQQEAAASALLEILPADTHDNDLLHDTLPVPEELWPLLGLREGGDLYLARLHGEVVAVILPAVASDGYSGDIRMIVGIQRDGRIAGVRVLEHKETPGLGDKVDLKKSPWVLSFNEKSLGHPPRDKWKVKKDKGDFDQFTGATITPRAVVRQVLASLDAYAELRTTLFPTAQQKLEKAPAPQVAKAVKP